MDKNDVKELHDEIVYRDFGCLRKVTLSFRRFSGDWSEPLTREVFQRPDAAAVLPYDPQRDAVLLIEQFRFGAHAAGRRSWQLEPLAGHIETGESAVEVARREALEEGGCTISELVPICEYLVSPGYATETVFAFCGRLDAPTAGGVFGLGDEDIRAIVMSFAEVTEGLKRGRFENALAVISLQWLALHRDQLRRHWGT